MEEGIANALTRTNDEAKVASVQGRTNLKQPGSGHGEAWRAKSPKKEKLKFSEVLRSYA